MYTFYFAYDGEVLQLPIPPSSITTKINNKNKTIELLNLGEVNILKDPGLTDISFKILIPGKPYPFAVYQGGFKPPEYYLGKFSMFKTEKKHVRFIISREAPWGEPLFDTNIEVSLESYTVEERAGEEGDLYVSLELKQYKEYGTQKLSITQIPSSEVEKATATVGKQRPAKQPAKTYKVKPGDSLWAIAKLQLNDGSKYKDIAKLNNISNPSLIHPGQTLRLS